MFATILTHAKTLVLGGSVLCGGAYGAHTYMQHHRDHRPDNRTAPVRIEHPDQQPRADRFDARGHDNLNTRLDVNRFASNHFNTRR